MTARNPKYSRTTDSDQITKRLIISILFMRCFLSCLEVKHEKRSKYLYTTHRFFGGD